MTKLTSKFLLAGAVAAVVIAISTVPSDAAKKRRAASKACEFGTNCSSNCANGWCTVYMCGGDGKFYVNPLPALCVDAFCVNKRKAC